MSAQDAVAIALVAAAAFFVGRRLWRNWKGQAEGACDRCER